ncbi:MAG: hypothetical protein AAF560_17890 [Acidobacteriota bacterium]
MPDLYTRIFERTTFPLLNRLNGTHIHRTLEHLLAVESDDPAVMLQRQHQHAERVVADTRQRSTFYRQLWEERPGLPSEIPALDGLPVVTKRDLSETGDAFPLPTGTNAKIITCVTSGSTGKPMTFHRSLDQDSWFWAQRFRIWRWAGYHPGDPYLTVNLNPRLAWKKKLQDRLFRCAYLTFNADNLDAERIVATLNRRRIQHLNGFSSSLFVLAQHMVQNGLEAPSVIGVTATGDTLFPLYRETIEQAFGVRVLDYYGAGGEGVHLASQCPESGSRYHLLPENAVMELLDDHGPVAPGTTGRIVVTQFHNATMPLVRYELGDLAVPAPPDARCTCGRTLPMLERLEGRVPDLVAVSDGTYLVPHFFVVLFKGLQSIYRYQIYQPAVDQMTVRLVPHPGCRKSEVEAVVTREVGAGTRGQIQPEFDWVDDIPLSGAGKRRLVISDVSPRQNPSGDPSPA